MTLLEIIFINIAVLIGFLLLNFPKGKIFLGDGGAYFLGFSLAVISLLLHHNHPTEISQWYPLALLIYPVFELGFSIYRRRFLEKKEATLHDNNHLHQLIYRNITKNNPLTTLYILKYVAIVILISTIFYDKDWIQIVVVGVGIIFYIFKYNGTVNIGKLIL